MSSAPNAAMERPPFSWARVLLVVVPALVVLGAVYAVTKGEFDRAANEKEPKLQRQLGFGPAAAPMQLDPQYTDADGDLLADTPSDPAKQISPDRIAFAFIGGPEAEEDRPNWKEFVAFLSKKIGKPVDMVTFKTTDEQIQAMRNGKLHVMGLNTGAVPLAVNTAGYVPVCTRGGDDGKFSDSMEVIVAADSPIRDKHLEDLKGRTVVFTDRTSNSGYKAAVVELKKEGVDPLHDLDGRFSGGHFESIKGIAAGDYAVGPVSREMLTRALVRGDVDKDKIRVIYESERFPPATLGYAYNLNPALAEKIKAAFLEFTWNGTGLEKQFAGSGATKFVPVSYKNDFALIRRNNDDVRDPQDVPSERDQASQ